MAPIIKDLWILRHGQATHNPRAEVAYEAGCSMVLETVSEADEPEGHTGTGYRLTYKEALLGQRSPL